jgi:hypothetical protein
MQWNINVSLSKIKHATRILTVSKKNHFDSKIPFVLQDVSDMDLLIIIIKKARKCFYGLFYTLSLEHTLYTDHNRQDVCLLIDEFAKIFL